MSSMRNAVQRRNHKERSQPAERQKWGLLEKKKDYVLRARDFNEKKKKLKILRQKASERNPDEFYYAMMSSRTRDGGIHVAKREGEEVLSNDVVKLLKTQDAGYVRVQSAVERKKIERLEETLALKEDGKKGGVKGGRHTVFVDGEEEARRFRPEEYFGTSKEMVRRRFNRMRTEQLAEVEEAKKKVLRRSTGDIETDRARKKEEYLVRRKLEKARESKLRELEARKNREAELKKAEREMELQRARMSKGGMVKRNKWARVRKR